MTSVVGRGGLVVSASVVNMPTVVRTGAVVVASAVMMMP